MFEKWLTVYLSSNMFQISLLMCSLHNFTTKKIPTAEHIFHVWVTHLFVAKLRLCSNKLHTEMKFKYADVRLTSSVFSS